MIKSLFPTLTNLYPTAHWMLLEVVSQPCSLPYPFSSEKFYQNFEDVVVTQPWRVSGNGVRLQ